MANSFLKPTVINRYALKLLEREIVLPRLVWTFGSAEFQGAFNDTLTLRLPAVLAAREYNWRNDRSSPIVADDVTETSVPVTLNHDFYSAVNITDEQLTMDIVDFGEQVLVPQVKAVARKTEDLIASTMTAATFATNGTLTLDASTSKGAWQTIVEARRVLNVANVPSDSRILLVGSDVEAHLLLDDTFTRADSIGPELAASALQDATITRKGGFTIVGSNAISPDVAYAFHPTAFAFANVAPIVPDGVTSGARDSQAGIALRWIRDYDPLHLQDRSVVSSFSGCTSVADDGTHNVRAVKINYFPSS